MHIFVSVQDNTEITARESIFGGVPIWLLSSIPEEDLKLAFWFRKTCANTLWTIIINIQVNYKRWKTQYIWKSLNVDFSNTHKILLKMVYFPRSPQVEERKSLHGCNKQSNECFSGSGCSRKINAHKSVNIRCCVSSLLSRLI